MLHKLLKEGVWQKRVCGPHAIELAGSINCRAISNNSGSTATDIFDDTSKLQIINVQRRLNIPRFTEFFVRKI